MKNALLAFLLVATMPASAASFDGQWFLSLSGCPTSESPTGPELEISGRNWTYPGRACELSKSGHQFVCSSDDEYVEPWKEKASFNLSGNTLTVVEDVTTTTYVRCPAQ